MLQRACPAAKYFKSSLSCPIARTQRGFHRELCGSVASSGVQRSSTIVSAAAAVNAEAEETATSRTINKAHADSSSDALQRCAVPPSRKVQRSNRYGYSLHNSRVQLPFVRDGPSVFEASEVSLQFPNDGLSKTSHGEEPVECAASATTRAAVTTAASFARTAPIEGKCNRSQRETSSSESNMRESPFVRRHIRTSSTAASEVVAIEALQARWRLLRRVAKQRKVLSREAAEQLPVLFEQTDAAIQYASGRAPTTPMDAATVATAATTAAASVDAEAVGPMEPFVRLSLNVLTFAAVCLERHVKEVEGTRTVANAAESKLCTVQQLPLNTVLPQAQQQRGSSLSRNNQSSVGNANVPSQAIYMSVSLLLRTAEVALRWLQRQQRLVTAGSTRLEMLQPTEAAAFLRSFSLLICHCVPLHQFQPAAATAIIPLYIHMLQQQRTLQLPVALSTCRALLLLERSVKSHEEEQHHAFSAYNFGPRRGQESESHQHQQLPLEQLLVSSISKTCEGDTRYRQSCTLSPHDLYAHLDRAVLKFLSRHISPSSESGSATAHLQQQREQGKEEQQQEQQHAQEQHVKAGASSRILSVALMEGVQLLLRPTACGTVRLAVGEELLQLLLVLQRDPKAYLRQLLHVGVDETSLLQETPALCAVAEAARCVFSWSDPARSSRISCTMGRQQQLTLSGLRRGLLQATRGAVISLLFSALHRCDPSSQPSRKSQHQQLQEKQMRQLLNRLRAVAVLSEVYVHQEVWTRPIACALLWEALTLLRDFQRKLALPVPPGVLADVQQQLTPLISPLLKLADHLCLISLVSGRLHSAAATGAAEEEPTLLQQATFFFEGSSAFLLGLLRELAAEQQHWLLKEAALWDSLSQEQRQQKQLCQSRQEHQQHRQRLQQPLPGQGQQQMSAVAAAAGCITSSLLRAFGGPDAGAAALVYLHLQQAHHHLSSLHANPSFQQALLSLRDQWRERQQQQQQQQQQQRQHHEANRRWRESTDPWSLMSRIDFAFGSWLQQQQQLLLRQDIKQEQQRSAAAAAASGKHLRAHTLCYVPLLATDGKQEHFHLQGMNHEQLHLHQHPFALGDWNTREEARGAHGCSSGSYNCICSNVLWESCLLQESSGLLASAAPAAPIALHQTATAQQLLQWPQHEGQEQLNSQGQQPCQEFVVPLGSCLRLLKRKLSLQSAVLHAETPMLQPYRNSDQQLLQLLHQHLNQLQEQLKQAQQHQAQGGLKEVAHAKDYMEDRQEPRKERLQLPLPEAVLRIQWLMQGAAHAKAGTFKTPQQLLLLLQDVGYLLCEAQAGLERRVRAAGARMQECSDAAAFAHAPDKGKRTESTGSVPTSQRTSVAKEADFTSSSGQNGLSKSSTEGQSNSSNSSGPMPQLTSIQVRVGCCVAAEPLLGPPAELLQLLSLFQSPFWLGEAIPALAAVAAQLRDCTTTGSANEQNLGQLQRRVDLLLLLQRLQQKQQLVLQSLKRVLQLQQQWTTQQYALLKALHATREQQQQRQLRGDHTSRTKQQERQCARWEQTLQRRVQQQTLAAEASKRRTAILFGACTALELSRLHFRLSLLRQLLLPRLRQEELLVRRIEGLLQRCRRIGFLRRQLKSMATKSSKDGCEIPLQQHQKPQQHLSPLKQRQGEQLREEVVNLLTFGFNELYAVLRDASELRQFDMRRFGASDKLTAAAQQQQHVQQRNSGDTFAEWSHTAFCSCSSSLLQAAADLKTPPSVQWVIALWRALLIENVLCIGEQQLAQQEQQRDELQQQLFAALTLRIRNQIVAGQQPLDVAELLSADCPLPPRVSAALFSLLYRQSIPLLLEPQQQQRLLFSAFRTEQEQRWCGTARQARGTLWALSPRALHCYLADQWKLWQRKADTRDQWAIFRLLACCLARRRVDERLLSLVLPHIKRFISDNPAATAATGTAATATSGEPLWPSEWLMHCEELPSLLAYTAQVAVFAAAVVAAVPSPLLPQEAADLWQKQQHQQQHQHQVQQRRTDTPVTTSEAPKANVNCMLTTPQLQQRIGTVLQQVNASLLLQQDTLCRLRQALQQTVQQRQQQLPVLGQFSTSAASRAVANTGHTGPSAATAKLSESSLQRDTAGDIQLLQPSLQILQCCSRLSLAFCSWGYFECLAVQLLLQVAAAAVHILRPLAPVWLQEQQKHLHEAVTTKGLHPPQLVLQQQRLSRARAAIEEAVGDLGFTVSLLQCFCPQLLKLLFLTMLLQGLMHATDLQRLTDDCDTLLEAAASARQHTTMMRPSERKTGELDISVSSFGAREPEDAEGGSAAARADGEVEAHTPAAATCGREAGAAAAAVSVAGVGEEAPDTALAAARLRGVGDWQLLEHEVARALHGLLPAAEGPPAKAALMRVCGVVSSSTLQIQTEEIGHIHHRHCSQQQRQLQQVRQHLLVFIAPADTCGRRQGILLPKKLLQLFVLRRLGWEVRLINLSACRQKDCGELRQYLETELSKGQALTELWSLERPQENGRLAHDDPAFLSSTT
ncbi:hypothetical protein, conserved [Eimeria tenella]|uniref:Uncharacterized protein n=1 Tax=Eimeria tenella TaxID=5802 RepID=U6KZD0_EIMTE|nr:hypothetical protein, conserved [Eimeria tenella]CDJ41684.1 hypothetical protein, conserved [Eimeria tenella]|eukprot:XP_013232434.1 hypothetical protein, conserved [Eimeria tenella]